MESTTAAESAQGRRLTSRPRLSYRYRVATPSSFLRRESRPAWSNWRETRITNSGLVSGQPGDEEQGSGQFADLTSIVVSAWLETVYRVRVRRHCHWLVVLVS